jgi:hypothetical protein
MSSSMRGDRSNYINIQSFESVLGKSCERKGQRDRVFEGGKTKVR